MRWASAISTSQDSADAIGEASGLVRDRLGGPADLVLVFASPHHDAAWEDLAGPLARRYPGATVIGCSAGGVLGDGVEVQRRAGLSITAATLPDVRIRPLRLVEEALPDVDASANPWARALGVSPDEDPHFVLLPDPFTFDPGALLRALDVHYPEAAKVGGLVSGAREPGAAALILGDEVHRHGFVGLALTGDLAVDTVVAQGCRPVGPPMFVTRCERNLILELDGKRPVDALRAIFDALPPRDQALFESDLFIGVQMRDQVEYRPGDFLIRNVVGLRRDSGALVIGAVPRRWQVVQLHVRDSRGSAEDLVASLERYREEHPGHRPCGGLMFSCVGRGEGLYGRPNHDSELVARHLGPLPVGGFFGNGEIGPVQGRTFVHGYASSIGLFRGR